MRALRLRSQSELRYSDRKLRSRSKESGINPKTVAKWWKWQIVKDRKTGQRKLHSMVLNQAEEGMIVAFRRQTLLPLNDCQYALQPSIPHLARSALNQCPQRHGILRLPNVKGEKPKRQQFKRCHISFFHIDIAEVQTVEGKLYLFVGIEQTSKFAETQLVDKANRKTAWEFLEHLLQTVSYHIQPTMASSSPSNPETETLNRSLFSGDPEVRIRGYEKEQMWKQIFTRGAITCCADGIRASGRI